MAWVLQTRYLGRRDIRKNLLFACCEAIAPRPGVCLLTISLLLLTSPFVPLAFAQVQGPTSEIFGGGSYVRTDDTPTVNAYGWAISYSQFPYDSYRWIGATIEANGGYASPAVTVGNKTLNGLLNDMIYTFMGGPAFSLPLHRVVTPYAHVLLGAVLANVNTTQKGVNVLGSSVSESKTAFGYMLGGGADRHLTRNLSARAQADWLRSSFTDANINRQNSLQVSVGLVVKF